MVGRALASAAAVLLGAAPLFAGAADSARPLRTLTFAVDLATVNTYDTPGATLTSGPAPAVVVKGRVIGRPSVINGSGDQRSARSLALKGTITVEVVNATDDAGLVADVSESAGERVRPKVRVGITADGALLYDPARVADLSEEEMAVVHWLARGFYGDHPRDVGTAWTVDQSANGRTDVEHYRVVARDAQRVTLEYVLREQLERVGGYAGSREGSLVYDTALSVPVKASFDSIARRQIGDSYSTQRTSIRLTLTADTFAARAPDLSRLP
jgi:hypothetical protein